MVNTARDLSNFSQHGMIHFGEYYDIHGICNSQCTLSYILVLHVIFRNLTTIYVFLASPLYIMIITFIISIYIASLMRQCYTPCFFSTVNIYKKKKTILFFTQQFAISIALIFEVSSFPLVSFQWESMEINVFSVFNLPQLKRRSSFFFFLCENWKDFFYFWFSSTFPSLYSSLDIHNHLQLFNLSAEKCVS